MIATTEDYRALQERVSELEATVERLVAANIKLRNQCEFLQGLASLFILIEAAPSRGLQGRSGELTPDEQRAPSSLFSAL